MYNYSMAAKWRTDLDPALTHYNVKIDGIEEDRERSFRVLVMMLDGRKELVWLPKSQSRIWMERKQLLVRIPVWLFEDRELEGADTQSEIIEFLTAELFNGDWRVDDPMGWIERRKAHFESLEAKKS